MNSLAAEAGRALADKYRACIGLVGDAKFDDFKKDCVAASYTGHAVMGRPEVRAADNLVGFLQSRKTAMPDWKLQPQLVMISGRTILAVNLVTGTHTGPLKTPTGELAPTKKRVGQFTFHRLTIDDSNKGTDEWAYTDEVTMLAQLGAAPKGSPPKRPAIDKGWPGAPIVVVSTGDAKEKENLEQVKKSNDAFVANKPAESLAMYAEDIVDMSQHSDKDVLGKKELEKGYDAFRKMWSDVDVAPLEMWAAGDYVVQTFTFQGRNKVNGKPVRFDVAQVLHFKGGKVDKLWAF